jgi:hypothetical protein
MQLILVLEPCTPVVARMQAFHPKLYDELIDGEVGLLRKRAGLAGFVGSLSRGPPSIGRAKAKVAFAAAVFPIADEQKNDHLDSPGLGYFQFLTTA